MAERSNAATRLVSERSISRRILALRSFSLGCVDSAVVCRRISSSIVRKQIGGVDRFRYDRVIVVVEALMPLASMLRLGRMGCQTSWEVWRPAAASGDSRGIIKIRQELRQCEPCLAIGLQWLSIRPATRQPARKGPHHEWDDQEIGVRTPLQAGFAFPSPSVLLTSARNIALSRLRP